jgi:hypothetical protein
MTSTVSFCVCACGRLGVCGSSRRMRHLVPDSLWRSHPSALPALAKHLACHRLPCSHHSQVMTSTATARTDMTRRVSGDACCFCWGSYAVSVPASLSFTGTPTSQAAGCLNCSLCADVTKHVGPLVCAGT